MTYLCHRGFWTGIEEQNSLAAFERAFASGYGIETDIRDSIGELVISHDCPQGGEPRLTDVLELYSRYPQAQTLALNVKSDGLQSKLKEALDQFPGTDAFVFDMSVPDMRGYLAASMPAFTRQSEYEPEPAFYDESEGVWLDCFVQEGYIDPGNVEKHLEAGKRVAIVSPELHKREADAYWQLLAGLPCLSRPDVMLCTDYPDRAAERLGR